MLLENMIRDIITKAMFATPSFGEGYAQAGAATFDTAVNWILYGQEAKQIQRWRDEDLAMAQQGRQDAIGEQVFQRGMQREGQEFAVAQFDFGKQKWGEEFALTKKQARQNLKTSKAQEKRSQEGFDIDKKRSSLANLKDSLNNVLGNDIEMKRMVAQRMGA